MNEFKPVQKTSKKPIDELHFSIKELKTQNDLLKAENVQLREKIDRLEIAVKELTTHAEVEYRQVIESERFAQSTLDGLTAHIAIVCEKGTILAVNKAWRSFALSNGGSPESVSVGANYLATSDQSSGPFAEEGPSVALGIRRVLAGQLSEYSTEYPCHSLEEKRWFVVRVTPFPDDGPRRVVVAHENITKRKELEREVVEIASLEQCRIGQDLHDSVGQELTALSMLAGDLAETISTDSLHSFRLISQMVQGLQRTQLEIRSVMRGLLPVPIDTEGLMAALSDLAERIHLAGKTNCTFHCPRPISIEVNLVATHLYLIAQEAVHNAVKHAHPKNINIQLSLNDSLVLTVQDDGCGTLPKMLECQGGLGLRIMQNRAAIIDANLSIQPSESGGILMTCILSGKHHETSAS